MAIEKLTRDNFEYFTLQTRPARTFASSSSGVTGSIFLFPRHSTIEKEVRPLSIFSASFYNDADLENLRQSVVTATASNIQPRVRSYMSAVNAQLPSARKQKRLEVIRFIPTFGFTSNTLRKNITRKTLMPHYRSIYPRAHFNYTNYHCLNFFTSSAVLEDTALLYPNQNNEDITNVIGSSQYQLSGAFSFDFWIKPKYTQENESVEYHPGCLMHLTSAYALSMHSSSLKDINGLPNHFQLVLALSSSADIVPSQFPSISPLIVSSSETALKRDQWNHVTIRWPGAIDNFGTGSFVINGKRDRTFRITQSLGLGFYGKAGGDPSVLVIGNYYEGTNKGTNALDRFFAADTATREGLVELNNSAGVFEPDSFTFAHPLNAEVHELKFYDKYLNDNEIESLGERGPSNLKNIKFYLPPFFTYESPFRQFVGTFGGVLTTPFFEEDGTTTTPFGAEMAFGVGGHYINLENYVRDFATDQWPRLHHLTGSTIEPPSTTILSANDFLYRTGANEAVSKRLYSMLPCDNGQFTPNFDLLSNLSGSRFINDKGSKEIGSVDLNRIISEDSPTRTIGVSGAILNDVLGARPEDLTNVPGDGLAILHRLRDGSSNQIVFFDVSNMYYGNRINPGSVVLSDPAISASGDKIGFTIKDDKRGNLYRADSSGPHPSWASVGNVFYDEGIILLKTPQLFFFGKDQFNLELAGEQNIHVTTINTFARALAETTSSNPSYIPLPASDLANDTDQKFVYITGINIHDENLNVIARSKLAQPIVKRSGDKMLFKVKLDW